MTKKQAVVGASATTASAAVPNANLFTSRSGVHSYNIYDNIVPLYSDDSSHNLMVAEPVKNDRTKAKYAVVKRSEPL